MRCGAFRTKTSAGLGSWTKRSFGLPGPAEEAQCVQYSDVHTCRGEFPAEVCFLLGPGQRGTRLHVRAGSLAGACAMGRATPRRGPGAGEGKGVHGCGRPSRTPACAIVRASFIRAKKSRHDLISLGSLAPLCRAAVRRLCSRARGAIVALHPHSAGPPLVASTRGSVNTRRHCPVLYCTCASAYSPRTR